MVLGFQRLNERTQRPNTLINFIKPLPGPDSDLANDFLSRIAAISYPIMRAHHITVMSLEEYPPNPEFVGRNFNAGEVIQLVLKAPRTGRWLSFRSVQMVMMHELAHCKQMNHSKAFWGVRDGYAEHLRLLWERKYFGEGVWGKGQTLLSGRYTDDARPDASEDVASLCGGVYRGRGRKRKRGGGDDQKPKLSYAERQQRRIARKFGKHGEGTAVGDDLITKERLEKGRTTAARPKVAGSKRGRELRAAAALARFETAKQAPGEEEAEVLDGSETESGSDEEDYEEVAEGTKLVDERGRGVVDVKGNDLVRICEDEDMRDGNAQREMDELWGLDDAGSDESTSPLSSRTRRPQTSNGHAASKAATESSQQGTKRDSHNDSKVKSIPVEDRARDKSSITASASGSRIKITKATNPARPKRPAELAATGTATSLTAPTISTPPFTVSQSEPSPANPHSSPINALPTSAHPSPTCPICSLTNPAEAATCQACAHVLDRSRFNGDVWACTANEDCRASEYLNAGDCGICGICGAARRR